jgi:hypothetical protein
VISVWKAVCTDMIESAQLESSMSVVSLLSEEVRALDMTARKVALATVKL